MSRAKLWLEFLLLFVVVPSLYGAGFIPLPKIPVLLAFSLVCLIHLLRRSDFNPADLFNGWSRNGGELRAIALRSLGVAVFCPVLVLLVDPGSLLAFPRTRPWLWLVVMILYPLLSAYPQELIYRVFFLRRYQALFGSGNMLTAASVLAFSFLHIIFNNWLAVLLTLPAGYVFTRTYRRTGSLVLASLEHALYGCIVFTSGLGRFFYSPS